MLQIGCHLSASQGYLHMGKEAISLGANTFQFFTRNPRGFSAKALDLSDVAEFREFAGRNRIRQILAHAPYTLNACSDKPETRELAERIFQDDLERLSHIPEAMYNFHPGSHVSQGTEAGIQMIADLLNRILRPEQPTVLLLETMSGKGSEVGGRFEEIRAILDRVERQERMGVCLDTCHVYDAGYDIVGNLEQVLEEFDRVLGLSRLKVIHLNDSKNPFASHKDRHEKIGEGSIGVEAFQAVITHPALKELPFYLETPNELDGYAREIALLKKLYGESVLT